MAFDRFFSLFVTIRFNIIILLNVQTLKIHWKVLMLTKMGQNIVIVRALFKTDFFFLGKTNFSALLINGQNRGSPFSRIELVH